MLTLRKEKSNTTLMNFIGFWWKKMGSQTCMAIVCLLVISPAIYAQQKADMMVTNEVFAQKKLPEVIRYMRKKYHLKIAYESKVVRGISVNTVIHHTNVDQAWDMILQGTPLTHQWMGEGKVVLRQRKSAATAKATRDIKPTNSSYYTFAGMIRDEETGEAIPYASVSVAGTSRGTATNQNGFFTLAGLCHPQDSLLVEHLGYTPAMVNANSLLTASTDISLQPLVSVLKEVSVAEDVTRLIGLTGKAGQMVVNPKETDNLPQIGEADVFRSMQLLPGISIADETSASLSIRGSMPDQNLVLFDGFTIYHLDHLYGFFSSLNTDAIKDIRVYKGGFDARYGGRISSVIDITGKSGNRLKPSFNAGLNLLSANAAIEMPIGNKATAFVSFRRSYTDLVQTPLFNTLFDYASNDLPKLDAAVKENTVQSEARTFYYYDMNGKFSYHFSENDRLSLSFYAAKDATKESTQLALMASHIAYQEDSREDYQLGNTGVGLQWSRVWSNRLFSTLSFGYSRYFKDYHYHLEAYAAAESDTTTTSQFISRDNDLKELSGRLDFEYTVNEKHFVEFGLYTTANGIQYQDETNSPPDTREIKAEGLQAGMYVQDTYKPLPNVQATLGIRNTYNTQTGQLYVDPRLSVRYEMTEGFYLKGAIGRYHQFISQAETSLPTHFNQDFWVLSTRETIPDLSANHYIGGLSYIKNGWLLDVEAYRKDMQGLIRAKFSHSIEEHNLRSFWNYSHLTTHGEGQVTGLDVMIRKTWSLYTPTLSYSLATGRHSYEEINEGKLFYANNDQRHELKFVNQWHMSSWTFSLNWLYGSGRPYSAPTDIITENGTSTIVYGEKNNRRLPAYHRMDASAAYAFQFGRGSGKIGVSVFNLYGHNNIGNRSFLLDNLEVFENGTSGASDKVVTTDQKLLGRTFSVFVRVNF